MPAVTRAGRATVIATVVLALAGCGDADGVPDLPPGVDPSAVPSLAPTDGPLTGLPACQAPPRPGPAPPVDGLVLPDGAVVTAVAEQGPIVTVNGYVPRTPVQVRAFYERRGDLDMMSLEDEGFEAEALFGDGPHRVYVKAKAVCARGSSLLAVVGSPGASVPTPAGGG